jgi:hypothetical protein
MSILSAKFIFLLGGAIHDDSSATDAFDFLDRRNFDSVDAEVAELHCGDLFDCDWSGGNF